VTQQIIRGSRDSKRERLEKIEEMIGNIIKESQMYLSEDQLRRGLGSQVRKSDFNRVLKNLENNKKIIYRKDSIVWSFDDNSSRQIGESTVQR
jgi:transposase